MINMEPFNFLNLSENPEEISFEEFLLKILESKKFIKDFTIEDVLEKPLDELIVTIPDRKALAVFQKWVLVHEAEIDRVKNSTDEDLINEQKEIFEASYRQYMRDLEKYEEMRGVLQDKLSSTKKWKTENKTELEVKQFLLDELNEALKGAAKNHIIEPTEEITAPHLYREQRIYSLKYNLLSYENSVERLEKEISDTTRKLTELKQLMNKLQIKR